MATNKTNTTEKYKNDTTMSRLVNCEGDLECIKRVLSRHGAFDMTLEEVGDVLGVSRERVRQIEQAALRKLRSPRVGKVLKTYMES